MKFIKSKRKIKGLYLIEHFPFEDKRGGLKRLFCKNNLENINLYFGINQINLSENKKKHTLRGFHYYKKPYEEEKILSCIKGRIYNVVLDPRKKSPTYGSWQFFILDEKDNLSLYIPKGCANGYLTLKNDTSILYFHSKKYDKKFDFGINYNDPFFSVKWPNNPKVISKKDLNNPNFV